MLPPGYENSRAPRPTPTPAPATRPIPPKYMGITVCLREIYALPLVFSLDWSRLDK